MSFAYTVSMIHESVFLLVYLSVMFSLEMYRELEGRTMVSKTRDHRSSNTKLGQPTQHYQWDDTSMVKAMSEVEHGMSI